MVERQKERYGWEFLFLGANITSSTEGGRSQSHPFWGLQDRAGRCDENSTKAPKSTTHTS